MNLMLFLSLLAEWKPIEIKEPFPSAEQIWAVGAALLGVWIFAVGASVGSFINVVVYRLPAGLSLSSPGSRCPRCLHPIRLQHNLPILGWLMLRGRCADCQLPISARYPLVELLVGSLFLLVGGVEILGNGINLPRPSPEFARVVLNTNEPQPLVATSLVHLVLLSTLVCAAIMEYDGTKVPRFQLVAPTIVLAIAASLWWPSIHPVIAFHLLGPALLKEYAWLQSPVLDLLVGGLAGGIATWLISLTIGRRHWFADRYCWPLAELLIAVGLVFGWQMMPLILALWAAMQVGAPRRDLLKQPLRPIRDLTLVVLLAILGWRVLAGYSRWLGDAQLGQGLVFGGTLFAAIGLLVSAALQLPSQFEFVPLSPNESIEP
jgi:leader peptidase (prepilin peptidase)/N-methyltransferase